MPFPDPGQAIEGNEIPPHPGLGRKDEDIMRAMIDNGFIAPQRMWFNQFVGNIDPAIKAQVPDNLMAWFERTYSKRPDVIIEERGNLTAIEVKPFASYVALGQALIYQHWAVLKADPPRTIGAMILTDVADGDMLPVAAKLGIEVRELGFFLEPRPTFQT